MPTSSKCHDCGQSVLVARVEIDHAWQYVDFTARPAIAYILEMNADGDYQSMRFAEDKTLYIPHARTCTKREIVPDKGALQCRSCKASIRWALSPLGHRIPMDAEPIEVYALDETTVTPVAELYPAFATLYLSHFASCANATSHSKDHASRVKR